MSVKSDRWFCEQGEKLITPFSPAQVSRVLGARVISFGTSSYGYDLRLANEFKVFDPLYQGVLDPKAFDPAAVREIEADSLVLPAGGFALARTMEYVRMPKDCLAFVASKSSYARVALSLNFTVIEPEWEGEITLELANMSPLPVRIHAGEGIAQLVVIGGEGACETTYADRKGKYMFQKGVSTPRLKTE